MSNKIYLEEIDNVLRFNFLNGELDLDETYYGSYAICPGCGSGKTTLIKELIKLKYNEGILYTAFTIDEVNSMYQWIKENMIETKIINSEDIIVLHSNYKSEGTDNNLWRNNPKELANKKIILCTHAKLLDEPLSLLISTNFNNKLSKRFPPTYKATHAMDGDIPRQWILIDEMPEAHSTLAIFKKIMLFPLGRLSDRENIVNKNGLLESVKLKESKLIRHSLYYDEFVNEVKWIFSKASEYKGLLKDETNELNKVRNEKLLELLYLNYQRYANSDNDSIKIQSGFSDLISDGSEKTHILLFDGTSDLTLYNSKKFYLLNIINKYSGNVSLNYIPFNINRSLKEYKGLNNCDKKLREDLNLVIDDLSEIIKSNTQTLLFCWKNFKVNSSEINDDSIESFFNPNIVENSRELVLNENFSLTHYIKFKLEEKGFTEGKEFSIEYYGSGRDKAINDYRDYDSVVLLGKYVVPNSVITDFNLMFYSGIDSSDYYTNRVIQAICRTRIRKHEGLSLNIYMSSDWDKDVVDKVKGYLGIDGFTNTLINKSGLDNDYMYNKLREKGITPKKAEQIVKLSLYDSNIFNSIMNEVEYKCNISLSEIFKIIPMSIKERRKYDKIKNFLLKYRIELSIE